MNGDRKKIFSQILHISGMNKHIQHYSGDEITSKYINRLELIEGEIEAGNNNKELLNELREVLMKLYHYDVISLIAAKKYLK